MEVLKISSKSNPNSVAGAIAEVEVEGEDRTGIKLIVESRA